MKKKLKVLTIFGTRPEAIKMAPVIDALRKRSDAIDVRICVTAQHRELLDQVLEIFAIEPDYDLQIMQDNQTLSYVTANILTKLDSIIQNENPDWILTQGDTTSAMTGALAGFYHRVRVGHIEAGLRTGTPHSPFPEEINRRIADQVSDLHFAPTERTRDNLLREGFSSDSIYVTGNTVIDALLATVSRDEPAMLESISHLLPVGKRLIVVTAHRRENFGEPFSDICHALRDLAREFVSSIQIVYPVHPNPHVRERAHEMLGAVENIILTEPLEYLPFAHLLNRADLIITDSGGIQEEAPSVGVPVLVLRESTERPEGVEAGTLKVIGTDRHRIVAETKRLLNDKKEYDRMAGAKNPYGDGHAGQRIVDILIKTHNGQ
ncbi:MAG: UDP-N-acetylglucosamine 2-epimerase (non-hydrolyzing) [Candidatus Latescibacteria bacterium]|nr:UDP-N-acetylglucosamine 2-epimerase (non-hydrolyzing) [Candidatus Latescibacterota bacterium]